MKRNEPDIGIDSSDDEENLKYKQEQKDKELARKLQESEGDDFAEYFDAYSKRFKGELSYNSDTDDNLMSIDPLGKYAFCK